MERRPFIGKKYKCQVLLIKEIYYSLLRSILSTYICYITFTITIITAFVDLATKLLQVSRRLLGSDIHCNIP